MAAVALRHFVVMGCVLSVLLLGKPVRADENTPIDPLPTAEEAAAEKDAISRNVRSVLDEIDQDSSRGRTGLTGNARTEEAAATPESEDLRIRRVIKEYLSELEQKKASLNKPPADDGWKEVNSNLKMEASWKNGLEVESANKDFRVHVGGRTQFDLGWFEVSPEAQSDPTLVPKFKDGGDFRRARLRA